MCTRRADIHPRRGQLEYDREDRKTKRQQCNSSGRWAASRGSLFIMEIPFSIEYVAIHRTALLLPFLQTSKISTSFSITSKLFNTSLISFSGFPSFVLEYIPIAALVNLVAVRQVTSHWLTLRAFSNTSPKLRIFQFVVAVVSPPLPRQSHIDVSVARAVAIITGGHFDDRGYRDMPVSDSCKVVAGYLTGVP